MKYKGVYCTENNLNLDVSLIVLAGGKGSRLGQEKAWVRVENRTLLERSISRLGSVVNRIIVVRAPGQVLPPLSAGNHIKIVIDEYPNKGPLVGIYSGLKASGERGGLVTACDMPFVEPGLARHLISLSPGFDIVMPVRRAMYEPLFAFYSGRCIGLIGKMISEGSLKIDRLLDKVKVRLVEQEELDRYDAEGLSFFNINDRVDLEKARVIAGRLQDRASEL